MRCGLVHRGEKREAEAPLLGGVKEKEGGGRRGEDGEAEGAKLFDAGVERKLGVYIGLSRRG